MLRRIEIDAENITMEENIEDSLFYELLLKFLLDHLYEFLLYKTKVLNINIEKFGELENLKPDCIDDRMIEEYDYYYSDDLNLYETSNSGNEIFIKEVDKDILSQKSDVASYSFLYWLYNYYGEPLGEVKYEDDDSYLDIDVEFTNVKEHRKIMIDGANPIINYLFVKIFNDYLYLNHNEIVKHREVILSSKSPELNYLFAKDFDYYKINDFYKCLSIPEILEHSEIVLNSNRAELNYLFIKILAPYFCFVENNSIKNKVYDRIMEHENVILNSKNPKINYLYSIFLYHLNNMYDVNIDINSECRKIIVESADAHLNYMYASFFDDLSKEDFMEHRKVVLESKDSKYNCLFAIGLKEKLSKDEITEHADVVFNYGNEKENEILLKHFKDFSLRKRFRKTQKNTGYVAMINKRYQDSAEEDVSLLSSLVAANSNEEIDSLINIILEHKNPYACCEVSNCLGKNLSEDMCDNLKRLGEVVIESKNAECIKDYIGILLERDVIFRDNAMMFDLQFQKIKK